MKIQEIVTVRFPYELAEATRPLRDEGWVVIRLQVVEHGLIAFLHLPDVEYPANCHVER